MSEKIPSIGNYLTEDKQTAIVEELGENLCLGRIAHRQGTVMWIRETGEAFVRPFAKIQSLSIVSPAPIPWRERILKLIETARRVGGVGDGDLVNGDITFYMEDGQLIVFRKGPGNVRHTVALSSPELIGAFKARMTQLAAEAARAHDDTHSAAIEALLQ